MKAIVMSMCAAAWVAAAVPAAAQDAKVEKGLKVYEAQKCGMCHSVAGKGNAKNPLDGVGTKLTAAELKEWVVDPKGMAEKKKAKPGMRAYPSLPAEDLDALVGYLAALKKK